VCTDTGFFVYFRLTIVSVLLRFTDSDYTHISLSPIRRGFAPGFVTKQIMSNCVMFVLNSTCRTEKIIEGID
jgi:hypothetical protein